MTSRRAWATYVTAHVGKSLLWSGSDLLTLYLLVSVYGLAANALADFAVGNHLARRPHHAGPIAAAALVLSGISFPTTVLLAPYGAPALLAATLLFRIAYSGGDVPHNTLLTRLGDTPARAVDGRWGPRLPRSWSPAWRAGLRVSAPPRCYGRSRQLA